MPTEQVQFGNPHLWQKVYERLKDPLDAIKSLEPLVSDLFNAAANSRSTKAQRVIEMFARTTARSLNDLIILVGNGCGLGAMILSRGMFEYIVMAEYLRRNPREQADYVAFGIVTAWHRYQKQKVDSPQQAKEIPRAIITELRSRYSRAAARLKDRKGNLRRQWHRKPLRNMAEELGWGEHYKTPYGLAASMHHGNFEGVAAHLNIEGEEVSFGEPSVEAWLDEALITGHACTLQTLETLNRAMRLGFKARLKKATEDFERVWSREQS
jgi:Family of unknown function (DUF5677)